MAANEKGGKRAGTQIIDRREVEKTIREILVQKGVGERGNESNVH